MRRFALIVLALLGMATVAAVAMASGGSSGTTSIAVASVPASDETSGATVTAQQALNTDAASYAADFGVTLAQARAQLAAQKSLDAALDRLEARFPDGFAGGWIEHTPTFRGIARFKGAVPAEAPGLAGDLVLRGGASRSLAELQARADQVFADVDGAFDTTVAATFDVQTGAVEVGVETPAELKGASQAVLRSHLPASARAADVQVGFVDGPVSREQHTYAGALTSGPDGSCTTGFTVYRVSDGVTGVLTAGHCPNDLRYYPADGSSDYDMDWIDGHRGDYGDYQWHTSDHGEYAQFYDSAHGLREVHGYISSFHNGDYLCKYGRYGGYECSWVHDTSVSVTDEDGFHLTDLITVDDDIGTNGDSGGPWFLNNDAAGITHGQIKIGLGPWRAAFSRIGYADDALPGIGLLVTN